MTRPETRLRPTPQLADTGLVAILRAASAQRFAAICDTLAEAGVGCLEITLNTPGALEAVREARRRLPATVAVGAGTVLSADQVRQVHDAGAEFIVSPNVDPDVIACGVALRLPCYPGALTPTEVLSAWRAGAAAVKLFPASAAGPGYLGQLRGPCPEIPLVPTGGVAVEEIAAYLSAGALAVGLGGPLLGDAAEGGDLAELAERARRALAAVREARS